MGLEEAKPPGGQSDLTVKLDSELIVRQLEGQLQSKGSRGSSPCSPRPSDCLQPFAKVTILHVPRAQFNARADQLANQAMDRR